MSTSLETRPGAVEDRTAVGARTTAIQPPEALAVARSLARIHTLLATAPIAWLSTLRPDGRPHVVPVWFDWDGELITVFSRPDAQKVRNVRHEARVMLAVGSADRPFDVELLEGEAWIVATGTAGRAAPSKRFLAKYDLSLDGAPPTRESFVGTYRAALRIRPTRLLDWGMRGWRGVAGEAG